MQEGCSFCPCVERIKKIKTLCMPFKIRESGYGNTDPLSPCVVQGDGRVVCKEKLLLSAGTVLF